MRKSSKLLAVLLTLCLLFGAITAIFVSADGEAATPVLEVGNSSVLESAKGADKPWTGNSNRGHVAKTLTDKDGALAVKYYVFDADFYTTGTSSVALQFAPSFTYTKGGAEQANKNPLESMLVVMSSNGHSLRFGDGNTAFVNTPEMYNHLTYVLKVESATVDTVTTYTLTASAYLNGEYVGCDEGTIEADAGTAFKLTRFATKYSVTAGKQDPWNGVFDSVTDETKKCTYVQTQGVSNYYNVGSEETAALEAALAGNANLYDSESAAVVYNANYVTPDAATNYVKINDATYTITGKAMAAIAGLKTGDTVTVSGKTLYDVEIPEGVTSFTLVRENGGDIASFAQGSSFVEENGVFNRIRNNVLDVTGHSANTSVGELLLGDNGTYLFDTKQYDASREIGNLSYITLDFDITFTDNPSTDTKTNRFSIQNRLAYYKEDGTLVAANKVGGGLYVYWNNGNPYIGNTSATAAPNGQLNCVNGVYDHITIVLRPTEATATDGSATHKLTQVVYLNGKAIGQGVADLPNKAENIVGVLAMYAGFQTSAFNGDNVIFKNVAVNHYTSEDGVLSAPLYNSDNAVYNANYVTPNVNNYVDVDSYKFYVPGAVDAIAAKIKTGSVVTVKGVNLSDVTVGAEVESFTVVCNNGTFALSEASAAFDLPGNADGSGTYIKARVNDFEKGDRYYTVSDVSVDSINSNPTLGSVTNKYAAVDEIRGYKYVAVDYDFAFTGDKLAAFNFPLSLGAVDTITNKTYESEDHESLGRIYVTEKGGNLYIGNVLLSNAKDVYDHVTVIYEITTTTADDVTSVKVTPHIYVNGEYATSLAGVTTTKTYTALSRLGIQAKTAGVAVALKNIAVNYYTDSDNITSLLADKATTLYDSTDLVYNKGYVTLNKDRYATVGNDSYKYYVLGAAFSQLQNKGTVYTYNVGKYQLPAGFALEEFDAVVMTGTFELTDTDYKQVSVSGNIYTYACDRPYVQINDGAKNFNVDNLVEIFKSLKENDTIALYGVVAEGIKAEDTPTSFTVKLLNESASFTLYDKEVWRYTKTGDTYKRVIDGDVYANVTLDAIYSMRFNFYIPYTEGLKYVKAYQTATGTDADSTIHNNYGKTTINGKTYFVITWNGRMDYVNRTKNGHVEFTYTEGEGEAATTVTLEARFLAEFNFLTYATKVATEYDCHSEEAQLVRAMIEYKEALNPILKNNSDDSIVDVGSLAAFNKACNEHKGCTEEGDCTCTVVAPENTDYIRVGTAHNSEYKENVFFGVSGRSVHIYVQVKAGQRVSISYYNVKEELKTVTANANDYGRAAFPAIDITDIDNDLVITVYNVTPATTDENGEVVTEEVVVADYSFEYSLADFSTTEEYADLLAALKKLAIAAENYKKVAPVQAN